tara:strand:+ start:1705 stop:2289 length:585 start_codon:yes stop_codon:yes gene_type:complete
MLRIHANKPLILLAAEEHGFKTFAKSYDLNLIGARNPLPRPNEFDDLLHVVHYHNGLWFEYIYPCTLDAGAHWMENPMRTGGTAHMVHPHQYRSAFTFGSHRGEYECLVQKRKISVWRDSNRNELLDEYNDGEAVAIQIHRASKGDRSALVNKWSAGCCVIQTGFHEFMELCKKQVKNNHGSSFSLTVLEGRYL